MEAFSLLKYWRVGSGGGGGCVSTIVDAHLCTTTAPEPTTTKTTTITQTVHQMGVETVEEVDDEGPFFDLEFAVQDEDGETENEENDDDDDSGDDDDSEGDEEENDSDEEDPGFDFTVSPDSTGGRTDSSLTFSPPDDLFFKGKLVEPSSIIFNHSETNTNNKPQFPVSLLKTATKFRVFMLGFKKPKSTSTTDKVADNAINGTTTTTTPESQKQQQNLSKFLTVKLKVEEVPIISLFSRETSSKISGNKNNKQISSDEDVISSDEKKFSKDVVQKYFKMIKPLYVKVSKRYGEKLGFSGQLSLGSGKTESGSLSPAHPKKLEDESEGNLEILSNKIKKQGSLPSGLEIVLKHLGKSRSASSAVAAVTPVGIQAKRRDDSLLQQQDGIQSAILHCKRSFNSSRDTDSDSSPVSRSSSDQTEEKSMDSSRVSFDEVIEASI